MGGGYGDGNWMWHDGYGWAGWFFGSMMGIVFLVLLIALIVVAVRYAGGQQGAGHQRRTRSAEVILSERLARGEIDGDEFRERMTALRDHR